MQMVMKVMRESEDEPSGEFQIPQVQQQVYQEESPSFSSSICRRARLAIHHLATHPLFLASVILMFVTSLSLLVFACVRLNAYRARRATFRRQYKVSFFPSINDDICVKILVPLCTYSKLLFVVIYGIDVLFSPDLAYSGLLQTCFCES